jgi:hypothetical protein
VVIEKTDANETAIASAADRGLPTTEARGAVKARMPTLPAEATAIGNGRTSIGTATVGEEASESGIASEGRGATAVVGEATRMSAATVEIVGSASIGAIERIAVVAGSGICSTTADAVDATDETGEMAGKADGTGAAAAAAVVVEVSATTASRPRCATRGGARRRHPRSASRLPT